MLVAPYKTKKALKESVGKPLRYYETSIHGYEYTDNGRFCVVGPSATSRKWFASITMKDGLIKVVQ
jgi:hypothetical protein